MRFKAFRNVLADIAVARIRCRGPNFEPRFPGLARFAQNAILYPARPLLAQMVVTRFCNLSCSYCNEFDKVSAPVAIDELQQRIDAVAALGTAAITFTGGEPLTHPHLASCIARARGHGMLCTIITNGFLLTEHWVLALNDAGLNGLQISIDNLEPDEVSKKSLRSLHRKLALLHDRAEFRINVNAVLGLSDERAHDATVVADTARSFGFGSSTAVVHDGSGHLRPLSPRQNAVFKAIMASRDSLGQRLNYRLFQRNLIAGRPNRWKCRAGGRYLYICEDGLVHYCSQQRGVPSLPITSYGRQDIIRENDTVKTCSAYCTLPCVHQMSVFDALRPQRLAHPPLISFRPLDNSARARDPVLL